VLSRQNAVTQALGDVIERFFGGSADSLVLSLVEAKHITPEKLARIQKTLEESRTKEKIDGNN
jgi:predicted transcriptional regulator